MNHLFGKKKEPVKKDPTATEAVTKLKEHVQSMQKREQFLGKKIDAELAKARECSKKKDKRGALMALKKKKLYEKEQSQLSNTILQMEQQQMMLEGANMQVASVTAMKEATQAMRAQMKEVNIDTVEDTMDEIRDQMDEMQEIGEVMGQDLTGNMMDEDDLEAEFAELEEEIMDEQLLDLSAPVGVAGGAEPVAAAAEPAAEPAPVVASAEDDELAALEAQMAQ